MTLPLSKSSRQTVPLMALLFVVMVTVLYRTWGVHDHLEHYRGAVGDVLGSCVIWTDRFPRVVRVIAFFLISGAIQASEFWWLPQPFWAVALFAFAVMILVQIDNQRLSKQLIGAESGL